MVPPSPVADAPGGALAKIVTPLRFFNALAIAARLAEESISFHSEMLFSISKTKGFALLAFARLVCVLKAFVHLALLACACVLKT